MTMIYCVKCKKKTETTNEHETTTKNGKRMLAGNCAVCGTKKGQFIKSK